ncbi:hypothetical protein NEAUS03_1369 [Nematocida ausubeli]|nr:hypothetical protein NEAUS03_1369 [Nematocida ausubeli]
MEKTIESGLKYVDNGVSSDRLIVLVGGLGDVHNGFYSMNIMEFGQEEGIRVVSLGLRSMPDYNYYTINNDVQDLQVFYKELRMKEYACIWFIGHSTGCQILMLFASAVALRDSEIIILQAPVSDREYEESRNNNLKKTLGIASKLSEIMRFENAKNDPDLDKHQMILYLRHNDTPFRADRFLSLFQKGGTEDFFSIGQEIDHINACSAKVYAILSLYDEYVVSPIDEIEEHLKGIRNMQKVYRIKADHGLLEGFDEFISVLHEIISQTGRETGLEVSP